MESYDRYLKAKRLYDTNEKFHAFVNKCANSYKYDIEFCFNVKTIQDVGDYYEGSKSVSDLGPVNLDICDCEEEDKSC